MGIEDGGWGWAASCHRRHCFRWPPPLVSVQYLSVLATPFTTLPPSQCMPPSRLPLQVATDQDDRDASHQHVRLPMGTRLVGSKGGTQGDMGRRGGAWGSLDVEAGGGGCMEGAPLGSRYIRVRRALLAGPMYEGT